MCLSSVENIKLDIPIELVKWAYEMKHMPKHDQVSNREAYGGRIIYSLDFMAFPEPKRHIRTCVFFPFQNFKFDIRVEVGT